MGLGLSSRKTDAPDTLAVDVAMATSHYERLGNITTVATSGPNKDEPQADITCNFMHLSSQQCTLFKLSLGSEGMLVTSLAKTTLGPTLIVTGETVLLGGTKFELQLNITYAKKKATVVAALFPVNPLDLRKIIRSDAVDALVGPTILWSAVDGYVYNPAVGTPTPFKLTKGLNVAASFDIVRSPEVSNAAKVLPLGGTLDFRGTLYPTFDVTASIPAPLTIVQGVVLKTCEMRVAPNVNDSSVNPFSLNADLAVDIPGASFDLTAQAVLERDGNFTLDAQSADEWKFVVGRRTLSAKDVHLVIDTAHGASLDADLTLGDMELVVSLALPAPSGAYTVHGHLTNNANVNMQKVTAATADKLLTLANFPLDYLDPHRAHPSSTPTFTLHQSLRQCASREMLPYFQTKSPSAARYS